MASRRRAVWTTFVLLLIANRITPPAGRAGRERGAFTGAVARQVGRFEMAEGSTILLDEIGELPLEAQVKLLRVLQDHVVERLGGSRGVKVDVRIIAAANRNLAEAIFSVSIPRP